MWLKNIPLNTLVILFLLVKTVQSQNDYKELYTKIKTENVYNLYTDSYSLNHSTSGQKNDLNLEFHDVNPTDTVQLFYFFLCKTILEFKKKETNSNALKHLFKALQLVKGSTKTDLQFIAYTELGDYYHSLYDYLTALKFFNLAKGIYSGKISDNAYLQIAYKIAKINGEGLNTSFALDELLGIIRVLDKTKDIPKMRGKVYQGIAAMNLRQKKTDTSFTYYKKALDLFSVLNDSLEISRSILGFGTVEAVIGTTELRNRKIKESKEHYLKSLNYFREAEKIINRIAYGNDIRWGCMIYMCDTYINLSNFKEAKKLAEKVYLESAANKKMRVTKDACLMLTEVYNAQKNPEKALRFHARFISLKDSIQSTNRSRDLLTQTLSFEFNQKLKNDSLKFIGEKRDLEHKIKLKEANQRIIYVIFIGSFLILFISTLFYLYIMRLKKEKQKTEYDRKLSEARITTLLAQINPHFVFNSLNSILSFIQNSNKDEAIKYLTKFSKIIRHVLEGSDKQSVSVNDEVSLLKLYIELEQLRCNHLFDFSICVNPSIDKFNTEIPVMILQPFIENALIHGIQNKIRISNELKTEYKGELIINYTQFHNKIICTVKDNGVGRKKSMELKNNTVFNHRSLGIKFTEQRLQLLGKNECKIIYNDLFDKISNEATGTEVTIELPILN